MNLCEIISNEYAENKEKIDCYVDKVCQYAYLHLKNKAENNARAGLTHARVEHSSDELDKIDDMDKDQKDAYVNHIKKRLNPMINPASGHKFAHTYMNVVLKKKKSMKKTRIIVGVSWRPTTKSYTIPQSNISVNCCICMETKPGMSLQCGHLFCGECSKNLISKPCPICRTMCTLIHPMYQS